jgi:anti-anti-sigma factor
LHHFVGPIGTTSPPATSRYRARPTLAYTERALDDGRVVIALHGDLDLATAGSIKSRLLQLVQSPTPELVIDLGDLEFLDSVGISVLVTAWREADLRGLPFALASVPEQARRVLDITGTGALFRVVELAPPRHAPTPGS